MRTVSIEPMPAPGACQDRTTTSCTGLGRRPQSGHFAAVHTVATIPVEFTMHISLKTAVTGFAAGLLVLTIGGSCADKPPTSGGGLAGDWDYYVMLGAAPNGGLSGTIR